MDLILFLFQAEFLDGGAQETLRSLSPWAYVIVIFAIGVSGIFLRLYVKEKEEKAELEKEFRTFMSDSLSKQIDVSKDVIDLVSRSNTDVKDALNTWNLSDAKVTDILNSIKGQLTTVERLITQMNNR